MRRTNNDIAKELYDLCGGKDNILSNSTCMTRLHITFLNNSKVNLAAIKSMPEALGIIEGDTLQIVFGPGKVTNVGNEFSKLTQIPLGSVNDKASLLKTVADQKEIQKQKHGGKPQKFFKHFANIFLPILPAIAGAGLINGLTKTINIYNNNLFLNTWWYAAIMTISWALFLYLPIFVGMNAAKEFKGTPVLGGIGGALSVAHSAMPLLGSDTVSSIILPLTGDVYNPAAGGILAAVFTGIFFALLEQKVRKCVPEVIDIYLTPLITLIIGTFVSILLLQPSGSFMTQCIYQVTDFIFTKMGILGGFILATFQLPLVSVGLHRAFTPIHTILSDPNSATNGINYLLPILMVAGGGQVGAALALLFKTKNQNLKRTLLASIPAGVFGVGEPLMYAITLPLMRPFITACIGSGFGGAIIVLLNVGAISQGVSGIFAPLIMNPGDQLPFLIGLFTAYLFGFILTYCFGYKESDIDSIF